MKSSQAYYGYELKKKSFAQYQNEQKKQQKIQKERSNPDWTLTFLQLTGAALPVLLFSLIVFYAIVISAF